VQIGPFLRDTDIFDRFDGQGDVSATITARGLDADDIINTLNGKASVSLKNGSLSGISLYDFIDNSCRAIQQSGTATVPTQQKNKSTPFADLIATAQIVNGVVINKDLNVKGKLFRVTGSGKVNLPNQYVDYLAKVNLLGDTTCWSETFSVPVKRKFKDINLLGILWDAVLENFKEHQLEKAKKALEDELKKSLGIPQQKAAPATPDKKTEPAPQKSPEELLKEELRKRLGL
jgi:AsmA protein